MPRRGPFPVTQASVILPPVGSTTVVSGEAGRTVVALAAAMDMAGSALAAHALSAVIDPDDCDVVVDLADVEFIDDTGIEALVQCHHLPLAHTHLLTFGSPSWFARRVLELCALAPAEVTT